MFKFSALFSAANVAAGFDANIEQDAKHGRVNFAFATLAADTLPLVKADGNPLGKSDFLKLARAYRKEGGKGYVNGYLKRRTWGEALDVIARAMGDADALDSEGWAKLVPAPVKAEKVEESGTPKAKAIKAPKGEPASEPVSEPVSEGPNVGDALNIVHAALKTGILTGEQCRALASALVAAGYDVKAPEPATF